MFKYYTPVTIAVISAVTTSLAVFQDLKTAGGVLFVCCMGLCIIAALELFIKENP